MSRWSLALFVGLALLGGSAALYLGLHWLARWQSRQGDPIDKLIKSKGVDPQKQTFKKLTSDEYDALRRDATARRKRVEAERLEAAKIASGHVEARRVWRVK